MQNTITRRSFLASATGAGLLIVSPRTAFTAEANSKIRLGVIGCGGRGTFTTEQFVAHGGYEIAATADAFADKADAFGEKFGIAKAKRFVGLDGHKAMLASG